MVQRLTNNQQLPTDNCQLITALVIPTEDFSPSGGICGSPHEQRFVQRTTPQDLSSRPRSSLRAEGPAVPRTRQRFASRASADRQLSSKNTKGQENPTSLLSLCRSKYDPAPLSGQENTPPKCAPFPERHKIQNGLPQTIFLSRTLH